MLIRLENISYKTGGKVLLEGISVDFSEGKCWAITGSNGSGKSLLAMIMGGHLKKAQAALSLMEIQGMPHSSFSRKLWQMSGKRITPVLCREALIRERG